MASGIRSFGRATLLILVMTGGLFSAPVTAKDPIRLTGAGASFPAPLYQRWFRDYFLAHPDIQVDYQAIGSWAGITNFTNRRIDFAGSDLPMSLQEIEKIEGGVVQIPMTAGAVVLGYNIPGIGGLRLSREVLAGIFLGQLARWNDPLIAAVNPGLKLPNLPITVVARLEASGTSYVMSRHLAAISKPFADSVGVSMSPSWPAALKKRGALIKGSGNGGVAAMVQAIPGAIGYMQFSYAYVTSLPIAIVENQEGAYVAPNSKSFQAAVEALRAKIDRNLVRDPPGAGSYPILTLSWLIAHRSYENKEKHEALKEVIRYCLTEGQKISDALGYIPLPNAAVERIMKELESRQ
jgi:phosphate transport system substrate-binding protein